MGYRALLREKIERLSLYRSEQTDWWFTAAAFTDVSEAVHTRGGWRRADSPRFAWEDGKDLWLRQVYRVPQRIRGIRVEGSRVHLRSSLLGTPITVFVDGKQVFHERSWADMRVPEVTLTESASPGTDYLIYVRLERAGSRRRDGVVCRVLMDVEAVEDLLFELETFLVEMDCCSGFTEHAELLRRASETADAGITGTSTWEEDLATVDEVRRKLAPVEESAKRRRVHLVGHAHLDMNWLWSMEDTIDVCRRDYGTMTRIMEETPDFRFSQSQGAVYAITEEHFPELLQRIKAHVEAGSWDVSTAATWTENDLNMASGEAIVRQLLITRSYMRSRFGRVPQVCWEPDTFGHPATLPQILAKSGITGYFHMRCPPGPRLYRWEGLDGSSVPAYNHTYNGEIRAERIAAVSREMWERLGSLEAMLLYGVGDHGGGPTRRDIKRMRRLDALPTLPRLLFSTPADFFRRVEEEKIELPVVRGEMNPIFEGCYTTHADVKARNRRCETVLLEAETALALEWMRGGGNTGVDARRVEEGWRKVLFNQFHDILCGCAVRETYDLANSELDEAEREAEDLIAGALTRLSAGGVRTADLPGRTSGTPLQVWNLQGFGRTDIASVPLRSESPVPLIQDSRGGPVASQVYGGRLYFTALDVPAYGSTRFLLTAGVNGGGEEASRGTVGGAGSAEKHAAKKAAEAAGGPAPEAVRLESRHFVVEICRNSGCMRRLYDKAAGRELIDARRWLANSAGPYRYNDRNNMFRLDFEVLQPMAAWVIGPLLGTRYLARGASVKLASSGEVMDVVTVEHVLERSRIFQEIFFYRELGRIDFHTSVGWSERPDPEEGAPILRVSFRPELGDAVKASAEIPFGSLERPADGWEYPCQRWVDLSGSDYGFALLNYGKYGYSAAGPMLSLTCLRTSNHPDPEADRGEHAFRYAVLPHAGSAAEAEVAEAAAAFNAPLRTVMPREAAEGSHGLGTGGGSADGPVAVEGPGIVASALKRSEDGRDLILRLYESTGRHAPVRVGLSFPFAGVEEVDLVEEPRLSRAACTDRGFTDHLAPFEIKTYRIHLP